MKDPIQEAVEEGKGQGKPTLVDFTAPWCSACVAQDNIIKRIRGTLKDAVVAEIDVEEHPDVPEKYDILSLPAILLFDLLGREAWRSAGRVVQPEEILKVVSVQRKPS